jgi:hypothetical protein
LLSDGQPHTVSLSVYNADSYFSATASLLLYLDSGSIQTSGAVTKNTLTSPSPVITEKINVQPSSTKGTVEVSSKRSFVIVGYVNTSHGKVTTSVEQSIDFFNNQYFSITANQYLQDISQGTTVNSYTTTSQPGTPSTVYNQLYTFPLAVDITDAFLSSGNVNQITRADQTYQEATITTRGGNVTGFRSLQNSGQHVDTLELNSSFTAILGNTGQSGAQQYNYFDSTGAAYDCAIAAVANVLTAYSPGCKQ